MEPTMSRRSTIQAFFDDKTWTVTYVVSDDATRTAAVIDPVLDFDPRSGRTSTTQADRVVAHVRERRLSVQWILETHAHADHLSAAQYLKQALGGRIGIGERITQVQATF
jgi:glyoxylase-like metal-dependent hydrolase (beta-lactamase superfamily II)